MNKKNQSETSVMPENVKAKSKSVQSGANCAKASARAKKSASKQQ